MSTHVPRFQYFLSLLLLLLYFFYFFFFWGGGGGYLYHFVLVKYATSSIRVKCVVTNYLYLPCANYASIVGMCNKSFCYRSSEQEGQGRLG